MIQEGLPITTFVLGLIAGGALAATAVQSTVMQPERPAVGGVGGVFLKADDPVELNAWYRRHLDIDAGPQGATVFWRDGDDASLFGRTVWSLFPRETDYFGSGQQEVMINYRVRDLDALLARLRADGVQVVGDTEEYWYGQFAWIVDGEGNRVELWEPVDLSPEELERRFQEESNR